MRFITLLIVISVTSIASAQTVKLLPELEEVNNNVHQAFDNNLKGWTRTEVELIKGSGNVIVENWSTPDRGVKISIGRRSPNLTNEEWLADALYHDTHARRLEGIGDVAVVTGYADNFVRFTHGPFGVSVFAWSSLNFLSQAEDERRSLNASETAATGRLLACFINLALSGDLQPKKHRPGDGFLSRPCEQELLRKGLLNSDILRN